MKITWIGKVLSVFIILSLITSNIVIAEERFKDVAVKSYEESEVEDVALEDNAVNNAPEVENKMGLENGLDSSDTPSVFTKFQWKTCTIDLLDGLHTVGDISRVQVYEKSWDYNNICDTAKSSNIYSSNPSVVAKDGDNFKAVGPGKCTISYLSDNDIPGVNVGYKGSIDVTINYQVPVTNITITGHDSGEIPMTSDPIQLIANISPSNPTVTGVWWNSSDATIAEVDQNGLVTFTGKTGDVYIQAVSKDDIANIRDSIRFTVVDTTPKPEKPVIEEVYIKDEGYGFSDIIIFPKDSLNFSQYEYGYSDVNDPYTVKNWKLDNPLFNEVSIVKPKYAFIKFGENNFSDGYKFCDGYEAYDNDGNPVDLSLWRFNIYVGGEYGIQEYCGKYIDGKIEGSIPSIINGIPVRHLRCQFSDKLVKAPVLPEGLYDAACVFQGCYLLSETPVLPKGLIDASLMFGECSSLTEIPEIPDTCQDMSAMFENCTNLSGEVIIPKSVQKIQDAFLNTKPLITMYFYPDCSEDVLDYNSSGLKKVMIWSDDFKIDYIYANRYQSTYHVGEAFNEEIHEFIIVYDNYQRQARASLTEDMIDGFTTEKPGDYEMTINYEGVTNTIKYKVV